MKINQKSIPDQVMDKNQKHKSKFKITAKRCLNFDFCLLNFGCEQKGVVILLVMVILSALLSVSIGIFNVVFGELRISGEIADSFVAFYAADQGIERTLYLDRSGAGLVNNYTEEKDIPSGGCYKVRVAKSGADTQIIASGQYRCGTAPPRVVKRGFMVTY